VTTISTIVRQIIDEAETAGQSLTTIGVEDRVRQDFTEDIEHEAMRLAFQRVRSIAGDMLSTRTRSRQEALPGLELPAWLSVPVDGAGCVRYVPIRVATVGDFSGHMGIRRANLEACRAEVADLRVTERKLAGHAPDELIIDVLTGQP